MKNYSAFSEAIISAMYLPPTVASCAARRNIENYIHFTALFGYLSWDGILAAGQLNLLWFSDGRSNSFVFKSALLRQIKVYTDPIYFENFQGSADSNYSQPSSDLSLDEEKESLRREKERQALSQLDKARVSVLFILKMKIQPCNTL